MIRKTLLLILSAAMVMAGCQKAEEKVNLPKTISIGEEQVIVSADSLSLFDMKIDPADAFINISDDGQCSALSMELYPFQGEVPSQYRILKVVPQGDGVYSIGIQGDASISFLRDSVRLNLTTSKGQVSSNGFVVISKASTTLPTQIQVQSDLVALKSDSVSILSISVFPSGAKLNIGSDGKCEGLNLVLDGSSRTPSEYRIAKVEETPNSQGGGMWFISKRMGICRAEMI